MCLSIFLCASALEKTSGHGRKLSLGTHGHAFFTKHAFSPMAMSSTLQEISWPHVAHSQRPGCSSTSFISHIGQAGLLIGAHRSGMSRRDSITHLREEFGEIQIRNIRVKE